MNITGRQALNVRRRLTLQHTQQAQHCRSHRTQLDNYHQAACTRQSVAHTLSTDTQTRTMQRQHNAHTTTTLSTADWS
jgi:hypothetical protein